MAVRLSARCVHAGPTTPAGGQTQETASEPIARLEAANAEPHTQAVKLGPGSRWDPFSRRPSMSRWWRRSAKSLFPGSLRTTGTPMRSNGCGLVEVARSSYYAWRAGRPARERRSATDAALREPITRTAQDRPGHGLAQDHCITAGLNEATQEAPNRRYVGDIPPLRGRCPPPTCPWPTGRTCTWLPSSTAHGRCLGAARPHAHAPLVIEALQQAAARPLKGA